MGFKPIWRVLATPVSTGVAQDVSYYVQNIDVQDSITDRSSTFEIDLWDHDESGLLAKFGIGDTVEIWSDTFQSASNIAASQVINVGANATSAGVSLPVKSWRLLTGDTANVLTSTSMDGVNWTPFIALGAGGQIQSPPYRWIRVQTTAEFSGTSVTINYLSMPKRLLGIVIDKETNQDGPNVKNLKLKGNDYTTRALNVKVTMAYQGQTPDFIIKDILSQYLPEITTNNVQVGAAPIAYIKFTHKSLFDCFADLATIAGWDWYVDEHKDLHWFSASSNPASVVLSSVGSNANIVRGSAKFKTTASKMKNKMTFYGGSYLSNDRTESQLGDGNRKTFMFTYKLSNYTAAPGTVKNPARPIITVNGVQKTVGKDGVDTGKDFYVKVGERWARQDDSETPLGPSDVFAITYNYDVLLIEQNQVDASINKYGLFEDVKIDQRIKSRDTARAIISAELAQYAYPLIYGDIDTWEPTFSSGQMVTVNVPDQGVNSLTLKITQTHHQISPEEYNVSISMYGQGA